VSRDGERQIGVFGGTFDPVHNGHLHIARAIREALGLDQIIWVPAGRPPHKSGQIVSSDRDRLAMLKLALAGSPVDEISRVEIDRAGPSYTTDTLALLSDRLKPARLVFLMGEDSLRDLPTWHDPDLIVQLAEIAVAGRPGVDVDLEAVFKSLPAARGRIHVIPVRELAISSSEIRDSAAAGLPLGNLVPAAVAEYIKANALYGARPFGKSR
jgi:nicotinate-nucleotide adenylyltransferase